MAPNLGVYEELFEELIPSLDKNKKLMAKVLLSGKESLINMKEATSNPEIVKITKFLPIRAKAPPRTFFYVMKLKSVSQLRAVISVI